MNPVSAAFDFNGVTLPLSALRPIRPVKPAGAFFGKYRALLASIRAVGLIEPLIVCPAAGVANAHVVLDGHLRLQALQELQGTEAFCQIVRDHDVLTAPPEQLASLVGLEAGRLREPLENVSEEDFRVARDVVVAELRQRYETSPEGAQQRWLHEVLLPDHPYGRTSGGTPESLQRLTLEDARAFVKAHYTPAHVVVVVSGPLAADTVRGAMELELRIEDGQRIFADLKRASIAQSMIESQIEKFNPVFDAADVPVRMHLASAEVGDHKLVIRGTVMPPDHLPTP
jgi:hypothetical protein